MIVNGDVETVEFAKGSKSAHTALFIKTNSGFHRIKMKAGNPFYDPNLQALVGKKVELEGELTEHFFIIDKVLQVSE